VPQPPTGYGGYAEVPSREADSHPQSDEPSGSWLGPGGVENRPRQVHRVDRAGEQRGGPEATSDGRVVVATDSRNPHPTAAFAAMFQRLRHGLRDPDRRRRPETMTVAAAAADVIALAPAVGR
jgi:hypothetical protein